MIKVIDGKRYIFIEGYDKPGTPCSTCIAENNTNLCRELSDFCFGGIFREVPKDDEGVQQGFHCDIAVPYLEGRTIEFKSASSDCANIYPDWDVVHPYEQPSDLVRISNPDYLFRVKAEETVRHLCITESLGYETNIPFCNTKATFVNGELTNLEILK
jgi:hypothetical protein